VAIKPLTGTHAMWRIVGFISGLALTVGGAGWLVFQLFIAEDFSSNLIVAAVIVLAMGAHWLGTDYVKPRPEGDA
jgi:hypothetical protein